MPAERLRDTIFALAAFLLLAAAVSPAGAGSWPGEDSAAVADFPGKLAGDFAALFSARWAPLLVAGATGTGLAYAIEDPEENREFLSRGILDPLSDGGNVWGGVLCAAPLAFGSWAWGGLRDDLRLARFGRDATEALVMVTVLTGGIKVAVDRERPDGTRYSFPSGHTATAFSLAPLVRRHAGPTAGAFAYGLAVLTAAGRLEDSRHHLSDVVAGATLGYIVGRTIADRGGLALPGGAELDVGPGAVAITLRR